MRSWTSAAMVGFLAMACGKKASDSGGSASASASASGSGSASAPAPPDAPAPLPSPAVRAKAALDTTASVVQAFTAAIGADRCGAADRLHAAVVANGDKIAQVKQAFADPAVASEAKKLPPDTEPIASAMDAWTKTLIDGDCKITEDKEAIMAMLAPTTGDDTAPIPPPAGGTSIPECDHLRGLAKRVDGCAAIPAEIKKTLQEMAKNNLDATNGEMPTDYIEYVRPKCAGSSDALADSLQKYACP